MITELAPREADWSDHRCGDFVGCSVRRFGATIPKLFHALSPRMMLRSAPEASNAFKFEKTFGHEN